MDKEDTKQMKFLSFKKGNFPDIFLWIAVMITIGIMSGVLYMFSSTLNENLLEVDIVNNNTKAKEMIESHESRLPFIYDMILPLLYLGFLISSGIGARLILSSHMFTPVIVIISPILIMFSAVVEIVWDKATSGTNLFVEKVSDLVITNAMLDKSIFFVLFYIMVVGIALYTKDD